MKKLMLMFFSVLLLVACTDSSKNDELKAYVSDFENSGFINRAGQIIVLSEEGIMIDSHVLRGKSNKKSNIDKVLEKENIPLTQQFNKVYKDATIKTDGSKYYVTLDENIKLEFEKVGLRIIEDPEGVEYYTKEYSEEN
ncbi:hypothetical protein KD050_14070 [Psychrobacillus sp. INOP01]|uniref:hypothetical protein n=1 Tax=Psychrobacillus sp. INOP01 TaxID=2829187 RepID=UPI001BA74C18|nr:hypothetical protein [Psychrobacillus sp. INOP01]QUG40413.1 hypothetical protein KD050_14070 [Psychrobacillus sp. INOP01]